MNGADDIAAAVLPVLQAFRSLNIRHYIGGSVASSFHGAARSTIDVDVVAEMHDEALAPFLQQLGEDYYASELAAAESAMSRFNANYELTSSGLSWLLRS